MGAARVVLTNCRPVLADRVLDPASVVCEAGRIIDVLEGVTYAEGLDCGGGLLVPGLVDTHSDGLEKEIHPRRASEFPVDFALRSFEAKLSAAGVTTLFHGVGFEDNPRYDRSVEQAGSVCDQIRLRRADDPAVDHRILFRLEVRSPIGLPALLEHVHDTEEFVDGSVPVPPLVSFEDHTPGQGQYRDVAVFKASIDPTLLPAGVSVDEFVEQRVAEAAAAEVHRDENLAVLAGLAGAGDITLLAHDCETAGDIAEAAARGATVAEFPLTVEAALAASEVGMAVVMGAPNVIRGGSHSGNVAAVELIGRGLCTALASDYQPSTLLGAAFQLEREGVCDLPAAIGLVTRGPADLVGLTDRGRLEVGARADVVLVHRDGRWPAVQWTRRAHHAPLAIGAR